MSTVTHDMTAMNVILRTDVNGSKTHLCIVVVFGCSYPPPERN